MRHGQRRRSLESLPEKGSSAGIKKGAGSKPGTAVLAKNPGTTLIDIPLSENTRSLGSLEIACISLLLLAEARATRNTVFQVQRSLSCLEDQLGGSNASDLRVRSTLDRSHSGTLGLSTVLEDEKALINLERQGCHDNGTPSTSPNAEAIDDR